MLRNFFRRQKKRLDELREESAEMMLKHMSPRERMRLRKQQKADADAQRMKCVNWQD